MNTRIPVLVSLAGVLLLTAACDDNEVKPVEYVRAIKTFTVSEVASGQLRSFTGIVQAADTSALSFQVSGNVQKVNASLGDKVVKGQVLATLDKNPYELDVKAAKAALGKARANLAQKNADFDRQQTLYKKGWVAKARLDQVVRAMEAAKGDVSFAGSKLALAQRDLRHTVLVAPFDGLIAKKFVDPFVEVKAGQKLFEIDAKGSLEIAFNVPETSISRLAIGMPAVIKLESVQGCPCDGRITEIGEVAAEGNAFPLKVTFLDPPANARSGMTGTVDVQIQDEAGEGGYLVPFSALAPGDEPRVGYVFVYDPDTSQVRRVKVTGRGAEQEYIAIRGVKPGDVIAVAGANFLQDGQKVKLLTR